MKNRKCTTKIVFSMLLLQLICVSAASAANKIMPLGDSITNGSSSGADPDNSSFYVSYRKALYDNLKAAGYAVNDEIFVGTLFSGESEADFDPDHDGHGGFWADEIVDGRTGQEAEGVLADWLAAEKPNIVLLHVGTNDITFNDQDSNDIERILDVIDTFETSPDGNEVWVVLALIIDRGCDPFIVPCAKSPETTAFNNDVEILFNARKLGGDRIVLVDMQNDAGIDYSFWTVGGDMFDEIHPFEFAYEKMADLWFTGLMEILPQADAGPDQDVQELETVTLNGSGSTDPNISNLSYRWEQMLGTPVTLSNDLAPQPTFDVPAVDPAGEILTFKLTVTNAEELVATDTVNINVKFFPQADAGSDQNVKETTAVTLDGSNSDDSDGTIDTYRWEQVGGTPVTLSGSATVSATFTAPDVGATGETLSFRLTVTDNDGQSNSDTVNITVNDKMLPVADAGSNQTVNQGDKVTLNGSASSDADGTITDFLWEQVSGNKVSISGVSSDTATFTAPDVAAAGETLAFRLTVTDDDGQGSNDTVNVVVKDTPNPVADAGSDQTVREGDAVTLDGSNSSDADGTIVAFQWTQLTGTSVTLSGASTSTATFTAPDVGSVGETLTFQLMVTDNNSLTSSANMNVIVSDAAKPIADASGPTEPVDELTEVTLDGSGSSDTDGTIVTFQWSQLTGTPVTLSGASTSTATFTAPDVNSTGEALTFQLAVTDNDSLQSTDSVTIMVNNPTSTDDGGGGGGGGGGGCFINTAAEDSSMSLARELADSYTKRNWQRTISGKSINPPASGTVSSVALKGFEASMAMLINICVVAFLRSRREND